MYIHFYPVWLTERFVFKTWSNELKFPTDLGDQSVSELTVFGLKIGHPSFGSISFQLPIFQYFHLLVDIADIVDIPELVETKL